MLQGGPHIHQIAGIATQLKEVQTPEFKAYIRQVKRNASALAAELAVLGHTITTGTPADGAAILRYAIHPTPRTSR